jgi:hypothetical protein
VPERDGCSRETPSGADLQVIFVEYVEGRLTVVFRTTFIGSWLVCAPDAVAVVTVVAPPGTATTKDHTGPCDFPVCDEVDETCQLTAMQFCLASDDPRCDALLYRFQRVAKEEVSLRLHAKTTALELEDCGCAPDERCGSSVFVLDRSGDTESSLWTFSLNSPRSTTVFLCDDADKTVASVEFLESCPVVEAGGPCGSEVCEDQASEDCQLATAAYCAMEGDGGCEKFSPRFIRPLGAASLRVHVPTELDSSPDLALTPEHCFCECSAEDAVVLESAYDTATKLLEVEAYIWTQGLFRLCSGKDTVATVRTSVPEVTFELDSTPCNDAVCEELGSEKCNQVCAAYCAGNPEDPGCALMVPTFERKAGAPTEIKFHVRRADARVDLSAITQVAHDSCGCPCPDENYLIGLVTDPTALLASVSLNPPEAGVYEVCAGEVVVARVLATETCIFEHYSASPCLACGTAKAMETEECQLLALEYCASSPNDYGCQHLVVSFERPLKQRSELRLFGSEPTALFFIPETCDCDMGCTTSNVGDTVFHMSEGQLVVSFYSYMPGTVKLCGNYAASTLHVATITITPGTCLFAHPGLCQCDFTSDETCVLAAAEYCRINPSDAGCAILVPVFYREIGSAAYRFSISRTKYL